MVPKRRAFTESFKTMTGYNGGEGSLDVKNEYLKLRSFLKQEKIKQEEEWRSNLPYSMGFVLLLLIVFILIIKSCWGAYVNDQEMMLKHQIKTEDCLLKYEQKHCTIDRADEECKKYVTCMKSQYEGSSLFSFIFSVISIHCK